MLVECTPDLLGSLKATSNDAKADCCSTHHCIKLHSTEEGYPNSGCTPCCCIEIACMTSGTAPAGSVQQQAHDLNLLQLDYIQYQRRKALSRQRKLLSENRKVTEYFPVRRSVRKCKTVVLEEKQRDLENKILRGIEDGLQVQYFPGKGRGIMTTRDFTKGEYIVEYAGELIDLMTAKKREAMYAADSSTGCYMYYFQYRNQQYCVDATPESTRLGRLINHSRNGNLTTKIVTIGPKPHLVLIAKEDIPAGVEISYDYGDRSRESIRYHPWLAL